MKRFASLMMGALAVVTTAMAADFTVVPKQGWLDPADQTKTITLTFDGEVAAVDGTSIVNVDAPVVGGRYTREGLSATIEGNTITYTSRKPMVIGGASDVFHMMQSKALAEGDLSFTIPAGTYTVNGVPGEEIVLNYILSNEKPAKDITWEVNPEQGWLDPANQTKTITLTFNGEVAAVNGTSIVNVDAPVVGGRYTRDGLSATIEGNTITYTSRKPMVIGGASDVFHMMQSKALDAGELYFTIPAGSYTVDGYEGPEIVLTYILSNEKPAKEITWEVNPAEGWLDPANQTKTITITFDGEVAAVDGTSIVNVDAPVVGGRYTRDGLSATIEGTTITYTSRKPMVIGGASDVFHMMQSKALAAGDLYFTIPAGSYTVDGEAGPEIKLTYILAEEDPGQGGGGEEPEPEGTTITPAADSHNAALPEVVINFGKGKVPAWTSGTPSIYWNSLTNGKYFSLTNGAAAEGYKCAYSVRDNSLVITLPNEGIAPGKYEFSVSNYTVDGTTGEKLEFNIFVDEPNLENAKALEFTVNPPTNAIQGSIKNLELTFAEGSKVVFVQPFKGGVSYSTDSAEAAQTSYDNWFNSYIFGDCRAEGNKLYLGCTSAISTNNKPNLWVYFAPGTIMVDGVYNEAFTLKYYLTAPDYFDYDTETPSGSTVMALDQLSLEFFDVDTEEMTFEVAEGAKGQIKRNGAVMENVSMAFNAFENFLEMVVVDNETNEGTAIQQPGHYQVVIPAGSFFIDGLGNAEMTLNYEIAYQTSEYTVNPEDGATIRGIKNLVVTFEEDMVVGTTEAATTLTVAGYKAPATYTADGNVLTIELETPLFSSYNSETGYASWYGEKSVTIPEGFYTLDLDNGLGAREGAEIKLTYNFDYNVAPSTFDFKATPEQGVVESLGGEDGILVDFYNATNKADLSASAMIDAKLYINGEPAESSEVFAGAMYGGEYYQMQIMLLDEEGEYVTYTEPGKYEIVIPAESFVSYGISSEEMTLSYEIVDMATVFEYTVEPAEGEVEFIPTPILSFTNVKADNVLKVAEKTEGYVNRNGEKMEGYYLFFESFFNEGTNTADFNVLISANAEEPEEAYISEPGKYEIVIPAGSFTIYGKANEEIALNYEIVNKAALFDYELVTPEGEVVYDVTMVALAFPNAKNEAAFQVVDPSLVKISRNGVYVDDVYAMVEAYYDEFVGAMNLNIGFSKNADEFEEANLNQPGEYVVFIPAGVFSISGIENEEIILPFQIKYPFVEYTANPEDGAAVESISSIVLTFTEGEFEVFAADSADYVEVDGEVTRASYAAENNTLTVTLAEAIESVKDEAAKEVVITIPADKYMVRTSAMASEGEPLYGPAIVLTYTLDYTVGISGIAADGVKVTVYDAQGRVILKDADAKELDSLKGLYIVNGQKQIRK